MSAIEVRKLVKSFNGQTVLHGIDLDIVAGEVVAIIGPSGSGKTTLLRSINLLEVPEVGFVFQNFNLFLHRSVIENIIEGTVIIKCEAKADAVVRAREVLEKVGLHGN